MKAVPALLLTAAGLAGAAAGFVALRHYAPAKGGLQALATSAIAATPAGPVEPAAPPARTIPALVPEVALPDLAGQSHALRDNAGHARLYNFWATWCEPCRREIPLLNQLQERHRNEGLQVVGIAVDFRDSVQAFLRKTRLRYTLLVGEEDGLEAAQKFGMDLLLPFSVFADEGNRIVAVKVGELHRDEAEAILAEMRRLKAGQITLPAAQSDIAATLRKLGLERTKQSSAQ
ncbi:MAG: TlpA family protein disulfide reductase [Gammaproteobacteria bacterium]|nr:TlpA family protein disulfide reductase [Gammaproteobacteria bacterium]